VDLKRIAAECGLQHVELEYSLVGRMPLTARTFPKAFSRLFPQLFSENLLVIGTKAAE